MTKNNKIIILFLLTLVMCISVLLVCSCEKKCEHTYGAWVSNGDGTHTKTCANDSTHKITESCHGGEATCTEQATCTGCRAKYGEPKGHTYSKTYSHNETHHWQEATCGHDEKQNYGEHTVDDSGWCTVCDLSVSATKGVEYAVSDDNTYASVVGYNGSSTKVRIADSYSDLPVTEINRKAFKGSSITEVVIPDSIKTIGEDAFIWCSSLSKVTIPSSVTSIGEDAFCGCSSLTAVYISDIAAWCNISFVSGYSNPLDYAHNLYLNNELITDLVIPDTVTKINDYAFYYCRSLTSITIPSSVTTIGEDAFYGCSSLTEVTIPSSVISIGSSAFRGCYSLASIQVDENNTNYSSVDGILYNKEKTIIIYVSKAISGSITIPSSVTSIGERAFEYCSSLISVTIPSSVTSIGDSVFDGCFSLTSVSIGNGVTSIGEYAFSGCGNLKSVTISDGVTRIEKNAFHECRKLTSVYYKGSESEWKEITISSYLYSSTTYYYSESNPFEGESAVKEGNYWHYDTDGKTIFVWGKQ